MGGENDNDAMMFFLAQRLEELRRRINPDAGIILAHHTRKAFKKTAEEDPFQALSGAGALRSYYSPPASFCTVWMRNGQSGC
jgi:putative DNA primase/helicase